VRWRDVIEVFRGDPRGSIGIFSTSQSISVLLMPLAIIMLVTLARKHRFIERRKAA
jgi:prolipoprotein diacylglyceryltransferase